MRQSESAKQRSGVLPPLSAIAFNRTHRFIPSRYGFGEKSVFTRLTSRGDILDDLSRTEGRTDNRLQAELGLLPGISPQELVANVPYANIINAAFTYARPEGSRFNGPSRGAWYAAKAIRTAQDEVSYHQSLALWDVGRFVDEVSYDDYWADFAGEFHDLRASPQFRAALDPNSYRGSQALGRTLLEEGSLGVVYPSVRHLGGTCLACFRPALVAHVRRGRRFMFRWTGTPKPSIVSVASTQA